MKDGTPCVLRGATEKDAAEVLRSFKLTHAETDFLLTYPEENSFAEADEAKFLKAREESENEIEICAFVDGKLTGTAGIEAIGGKEKIRHRAELGIAIEREYWGRGIGKALMLACIECAKNAGYLQLELEVVTDNASAVRLYESVGFREFRPQPQRLPRKTWLAGAHPHAAGTGPIKERPTERQGAFTQNLVEFRHPADSEIKSK